MTSLGDDIKNNYLSLIKNHLNIDDEEIKKFCLALKESNALIAGGSVVKSVFKGNWFVEDLDIYVNIKNCIPIRKFLLTLSVQNVESKGRNNFYCNSFLKKNRIYKVIRFNIPGGKHIDLMYVYNNKPLLEVVNNFDLTCCQSWFDGENVFTSHPETLETKACYINPDYAKTLFQGNVFTKKRLEKYISRGFSFTIPSYAINSSNIYTFNNKSKLDTKEYMKKLVFDSVFGIIGEFNKTIFDEILDNFISVKYEDKIYFNEDGYDHEEFNSLEDYKKIGKGDVAEKVVKFLQKSLDDFCGESEDFSGDIPRPIDCLPIYTLIGYREALYEIFNLSKDKSGKKNKNMYPEFKEMCYDSISMTEMEAGEFLSQNPNQNILIKCGDKLMAFKRKELIKFCQDKTIYTKNNTLLTHTYLRHNILYEDRYKFNFQELKMFILKDNDVKIDGYNVHIVEPISIEKYLKN